MTDTQIEAAAEQMRKAPGLSLLPALLSQRFTPQGFAVTQRPGPWLKGRSRLTPQRGEPVQFAYMDGLRNAVNLERQAKKGRALSPRQEVRFRKRVSRLSRCEAGKHSPSRIRAVCRWCGRTDLELAEAIDRVFESHRGEGAPRS